MKRLITNFILILFLVGLTGCVAPFGSPLGGIVYTKIYSPGYVGDLDAKFENVGQATAQGIVCIATGDASIATAARSAGITKIHHVDVEYTSILGVYGEVTTTVYGE